MDAGRGGLFEHMAARCGAVRLVPAEPARLAALVAAGLHTAGEPLLLGAWYDPGDLAGSAARTEAYHRRCMADVAPGAWTLSLGVLVDGTLAGSVTLHPAAAPPGRVVSGSWLAPPFRGRGVGTLARAALLTAAFGPLAATEAASVVVAGNAASEGVSRKLGYRRDATLVVAHGGEARVATRLVVDAASLRLPAPAVTEGFDRFAAAAGLAG